MSTAPFDFDTILITSVGRGDRVVVDTLKNDTRAPLLGDFYGLVHIQEEQYVLVPYYRAVAGNMALRWQLIHKDDIGNLAVPQQVIEEELRKFED